MKKGVSVLSLMLLLLTGCLASLFPSVNPATDLSSSLIILEAEIAEKTNTGKNMEFSLNTFASGFYPVVIGPDGKEVGFRLFEGSARGGIYYYIENVTPGKYIVKGFRHLWMTQDDFLHTPIKDLEFNGQSTRSFVQKDLYPFDKPVEIHVQKGKVASLGKYSFSFKPVEATSAKADNRRKAETFTYTGLYPEDTGSLADMKNWRAGNWPAWNVRNDVPAKD